jgi:hypothetical protein
MGILWRNESNINYQNLKQIENEHVHIAIIWIDENWVGIHVHDASD